MTTEATWALLVVAAAHAGFQVTVTVLVYPALASVGSDRWTPAHDRHSRRIAPLVVLLYGGFVVTGVWAAATEPLRTPLVAALALAAGTLLLTGAVAAPLHGRLGADGPRPELLDRLLRVDRARAVLAVLTLVAAAAVPLTS